MADANRCRNCDLCCNGELCSVCNSRRRCQYCLRRLPSHCFNDDDVDDCKVTIDVKYYNLFFKCNLGLFFKPYICCNNFVVVCAARRYERPFPQMHCVTRCFNSDGFDTSEYNSSYEELFNHLRDDIVGAIQSQLQLNG